MGILYDNIKRIQERIEKESHRPWKDIIEEFKRESKVGEINEKCREIKKYEN